MNFLFDKLLLAAFLGMFLESAAQVPKTMLRLPDTGQNQSFTNTPGEDSDYEQNPPFLSVHSDGRVTDNVTGLMWQRSDGGEMTIENAELYCQNLLLGGFDDWRLPTAQEAFSILNHGFQNPPLDPAIFPNTGAEYWWTSERQAGNTGKVWVTNAGGGIGNHPKVETISAGGTKKMHVRAVRDLQPPPMVDPWVHLDSVVMDHLTGLEWQDLPAPDSLTWENALHYAENLVLQGQSDWRLPNVKELESLNDETRSQPSLNTSFFPNIGSKKYWTSTSLPNQSTQAWFMDTRFGVISHESKTAKNSVLCVRGLSGATTAVTEIPPGAFRVYPIPFSSGIQVEVASAEGLESGLSSCLFQLFDSFGRLVFSGKNLAEQDFSGLPGGMYVLKISGKNPAVLQLIKY